MLLFPEKATRCRPCLFYSSNMKPGDGFHVPTMNLFRDAATRAKNKTRELGHGLPRSFEPLCKELQLFFSDLVTGLVDDVSAFWTDWVFGYRENESLLEIPLFVFHLHSASVFRFMIVSAIGM
ncbi:hypothetical protein V6N13_134300 [Hibiscus sabdariffa]